MSVSNYLSEKIRVLSFTCIVLVLYLHSYANDIKLPAVQDINIFVQDFISQGITRVAVPVFFLVSGYLFYINITPNAAGFSGKMKKRFYSLVIPFLIWNGLGFLIYLFLQSFSMSKGYFRTNIILDYSFYDFLNKFFYEPFVYPLWFVRDLIEFAVLSPLIYWLIKKLRVVFIIILFIIWFLGIKPVIFTGEGILFFSLGAYIALQDLNIERKISSHIAFGLIAAWLLMTLIKTCFLWGTEIHPYFNGILILIGVAALWFGYDHLMPKGRIKEVLLKVSPFTFFIYAFHEPTNTIIKKLLYKIYGGAPASELFLYLTIPIMVLCIGLTAAYLLKKQALPVYKVFTGDR